jgi:hypothetical protein
MEEIIRNVRDLPMDERRTLEQVLGRKLRKNQQVVLRVVTLTDGKVLGESQPSPDPRPAQTIEDWARVYDGLSDEEIEEIDRIAKTRANLSRNVF